VAVSSLAGAGAAALAGSPESITGSSGGAAGALVSAWGELPSGREAGA
jgi:hypothetical protein